MGLTKSKLQNSVYPEFSTLEEAINYYYNETALENRHYAIEKMVFFDGGAEKVVELLYDEEAKQDLLSFMGSTLSKLDPKVAPIDEILELLKSENAYIRNLAISILQDYGEEIKYYIVKYLISGDRDLRIFAINILGDVNFVESRDMLLELLEQEKDINVAMTAVDYLGEIGQEEDIDFLKTLKERFKDEAYVEFAIDSVIASIKA